MNSRYQDKVVEELKSLSDFIYAELEKNSPMSYDKHFEFIKKETKICLQDADNIHKGQRMPGRVLLGGVHCDPWLVNIETTMDRVKNNPFLPKFIRQTISKYYLERCSMISEILIDEFPKFREYLLNYKLEYKKQDWTSIMQNRLIGIYSKKGLGHDQIKVKITQFREMIYEYLQSMIHGRLYLPEGRSSLPKR